MARLVVLGSGTPNADVGRAGAAVAVVADTGAWVLIDAGRAATQRAIDAALDLTQLMSVLLTHHHSDHVSDLATLATTRWVMGAVDPLRVVAPLGASTRFAAACLDAYDDSCFHGQSAHGGRPTIAVHGFEPSSSACPVWQSPGWSVDAALVDHHPVSPAVGYRVRVDGVGVAVSGDTAVCDGIRSLAVDADVLVHEAVLSAAASASLLAWNAGAASVGQMASQVGVRTLVLTHMLPAPRDADDEAAFVDEARSGGWNGPLHIARDLLSLELRPR
jgi:ribonuclease Z